MGNLKLKKASRKRTDRNALVAIARERKNTVGENHRGHGEADSSEKRTVLYSKGLEVVGKKKEAQFIRSRSDKDGQKRIKKTKGRSQGRFGQVKQAEKRKSSTTRGPNTHRESGTNSPAEGKVEKVLDRG